MGLSVVYGRVLIKKQRVVNRFQDRRGTKGYINEYNFRLETVEEKNRKEGKDLFIIEL